MGWEYGIGGIETGGFQDRMGPPRLSGLQQSREISVESLPNIALKTGTHY
jgi:hypothetical protein